MKNFVSLQKVLGMTLGEIIHAVELVDAYKRDRLRLIEVNKKLRDKIQELEQSQPEVRIAPCPCQETTRELVTYTMRLERENQELKEEKVRLADELEKLWEQL